MIELLHLLKDTISASFGEVWIVMAMALLFFFTLMNMMVREPISAFFLTVMPFSMIVTVGLLPISIAGYILLTLALLMALTFQKVFIR